MEMHFLKIKEKIMCELCRHNPCISRCPNVYPHKYVEICSVCGDGIYDGEEYIENDCGDYAHWECVYYGRDLVKFLGYEIKEMEER